MVTIRSLLRAARAPLLVHVLAMAAAFFGGCDRGSSGAGRTPVKLVMNWVPEPEFGGFYAAREKGAYERAGLDVELVPGGPGVPVV